HGWDVGCDGRRRPRGDCQEETLGRSTIQRRTQPVEGFMAFRHRVMLDEGSLVPDPVATFKDQSAPTPAPCPPPMAVLDLGALDGTNGFRIDGASDYDYVGSAVAGAGDVNGDGYADVIMGASFADIGGNTIGAAYVVFGRAAGGPPAIDLSALDGAN